MRTTSLTCMYQGNLFPRLHDPKGSTPMNQNILFCHHTTLKKKKVTTNFSHMRNKKNANFITCKWDKNLRLTILETSIYIERVVNDHLSDRSTYKYLSEEK
eukprot:14376810-Ditylum_brightwellii.AAC.1